MSHAVELAEVGEPALEQLRERSRAELREFGWCNWVGVSALCRQA